MEMYFKNSKKLIDEKIHLYLFFLLNYIFLGDKYNNKQRRQHSIKEKLESLTKEINKNIFQNPDKYIKIEYSIKNFTNIIEFIKIQNKNYAGEIVEDILIYIFSKVIRVDSRKTFGKYIFNNLYSLTMPSYKLELQDWFKQAPNLFNETELKEFKKLIEYDCSIENELKKPSKFYKLLKELYINKNAFLQYIRRYKNSKTFNYINSSVTGYKDPIYDSLDTSTSISQASEEIKTEELLLVREFLISVFIYYQNKHSPLMKFIPKKDDKNKIDDTGNNVKDKENKNKLADIPFEYDLKDANIESMHTKLIFSPLRIEPRISKISLVKNKLKDLGLFELSKMLLFNPNIKKIEYNQVVLKSYLLEYFNLGISLFDNYSVEELNLSSNYLNEDCGEFLTKILTHLKGLKTLNLSNTDLKSSAATLFIVLKKLYQKKKQN